LERQFSRRHIRRRKAMPEAKAHGLRPLWF
jgi:hypothetical protein